MKAKIVEFHPVQDSLESERGLLVGNALILPDKICKDEVIVRLRSKITTGVIVEVGEIEIPERNLQEALRNHFYNQGWFGAAFVPFLDKTRKLRARGC